MKKNILFLSLIFFLNLPAFVFAQAGMLDRTFGYGGINCTEWGGNWVPEGSMLIRPDDKIVLTTYHFTRNETDLFFTRWTKDGIRDTTFGMFGVVKFDMGLNEYVNGKAALTPSGKFVIPGGARFYSSDSNDSTHFILFRFNSDGTIDSSFNNCGYIIWEDAEYRNSPGVVVQDDEKIILALNAYGTGNALLVRYNIDGTEDVTFGNNGRVSLSNGISQIALQDDGKIVILSIVLNGSEGDIMLLRFNSDGSVDNTFGNNGITTLRIPTTNEVCSDIAFDSYGRIIVAGSSRYHEREPDMNISFLTARFLNNGKPDSTFNGSGFVKTSADENSNINIAKRVFVQPDNKVIVGGITFKAEGGYSIAMLRYNEDGTRDMNFGYYGLVVLDMYYVNDIYDVKLQSNNKIILSGSVTGTSEFAQVLARYRNNVTDVEEEDLPVSFMLSQNYPNPFNPTTMRKYSIPANANVETHGRVSLRMYNVLGEEVATLVNEKQSPGEYSVQFNATDLPSGVYFYTLHVGDFVETRKMILLK